MATYAAMIEIMDDGIGQLIDVLKKNGQYENTLIVFLSDNGSTPERKMWVPIYVLPSAIPHLVESRHKLLREGYHRLSFSVGPKN